MLRKKILTVTHYTALYGANRSLLNLIEGSQSELEWIVICKRSTKGSGDIRDELDRIGVKHITIPFRIDVYSLSVTSLFRMCVFPFEFLFNFLIACFIAFYARIKKVQVVHTNSSATCFGAYISLSAGLRHIWHFREFLDIDYHYDYKFGPKYLKFWGDKASCIIAVSSAVKTRAVVGRNIKTKTHVLYNGVIFNNNMPPIKYKSIRHHIELVIVGLIDSAKNQLQAIEACRLLNRRGISATLKVIGEPNGSYYQCLTKYVRENNLQEFVSFPGYKSELSSIFNSAHITIMASPNEGMGRVTIESMVFSTPVVGFDSAGTSELIEHGETGILYSGDSSALADAIALLAENPALYRQLIEHGYEAVKQRFTIESYVEAFINLVQTK